MQEVPQDEIERQRQRLEALRAQREAEQPPEPNPEAQRSRLEEYRLSRTQELQRPSVTNPSRLRPGIQAETFGGFLGELGADVGMSALTGASRGIVTTPQIPLAAGNLAARGYSSVADLFRAEGDRGQYEPPLPTREDWLTGAQRIGLIDEVTRFYEPQTPLGRIFEFGGAGFAEGVATGGTLAAGRMALGRGARTFDRTGRSMIASDALGEGVAGLTGGGLAGAALEMSDDPTLSLGAGLLGGFAGSRAVFANRRYEEMVRSRTTDVTPEEFDRAREIAQAAESLGIEIMPIEALAAASQGGADDLAVLARNVIGVTPQGGRARRAAVERAQAGGSVEQAFRARLDEVRAGADPMDTEQAATRLIDLAQRTVRDARATRSQAVRAERDALRNAAAPLALVQRIDAELANTVERLSPNSTVRQEVERFRRQLRDGNDLDAPLNLNADNLDEFFDLYYATVNASDFQRSVGDNRLAVRINDRMRELDRAFTNQVSERAAFKEAYRAASPPVTQVETMLGGIGSASDREIARNTIRRLFEVGPEQSAGDLAQLGAGFRVIAREDPRLAGELLAQHMDLVFGRNMREAVDSRRPINSPAQFRRALYGNSQTQTAIGMMLNALDAERGLTPGTTARAFQNFMDTLAATGQVDMQRPNIGQALSEARQGRGISGLAQALGRTSLVAPFYAVSSAWQRATGENTYRELARLFTGGGRPGVNTEQFITEIERMAAAAPRSPEALIAAGTLLGARQGQQPPETEDESDGNQ